MAQRRNEHDTQTGGADSPPPELPIARRLAHQRERGEGFFPLLWRPLARPQRLPMVGWFDPGQLIQTGLKSLFSLVVGERSDRRIIQALAASRQEFYDCSTVTRAHDSGMAREELWVDYVCDTGDGWNPTYAVAYALAQPALEVADGARVHRLPRADLLVFGGDLVYPTASREEYQRRLIHPYETAFGEAHREPAPQVFAIPGNHDWYDGLSAFSRLFCSDVGGRGFAGWRTRQSRSYFAIRLPHGWWLLGSDGQLQSDIDTPQIEYFRDIARNQMRAGDRAILCLSLPVWIYAHKYRKHGGVFDETDLVYLREEVFARHGIALQVYLSGDLHHYRRHEEIGLAPGGVPVQKITAGGGGAFLHPTHDEDVSELIEENGDERSRRFVLRKGYPSLRTSWWLSWGNLLFARRNPRFGIVPALLYLLTAWLVGAATDYAQPAGPVAALRITLDAFAREPGLALWVIAVVALFVLFTDTHARVYRWIAGLAHAGAHWAAMFYIGWGARLVGGALFDAHGIGQFLLSAGLVFAGGWVVGSFIMGLYLLVSLNVFGRHSEEAFSALKVQDYKHFLRLHIGRDGSLTIYPVKIDRVPRRWRARRDDDDTPSLVVPEEPLVPGLIEAPVVVPASGASATVGART